MKQIVLNNTKDLFIEWQKLGQPKSIICTSQRWKNDIVHVCVKFDPKKRGECELFVVSDMEHAEMALSANILIDAFSKSIYIPTLLYSYSSHSIFSGCITNAGIKSFKRNKSIGFERDLILSVLKNNIFNNDWHIKLNINKYQLKSIYKHQKKQMQYCDQDHIVNVIRERLPWYMPPQNVKMLRAQIIPPFMKLLHDDTCHVIENNNNEMIDKQFIHLPPVMIIY